MHTVKDVIKYRNAALNDRREDKAAIRRQLEADMKAFRKRGGKTEKVPIGVTMRGGGL